MQEGTRGWPSPCGRPTTPVTPWPWLTGCWLTTRTPPTSLRRRFLSAGAAGGASSPRRQQRAERRGLQERGSRVRLQADGTAAGGLVGDAVYVGGRALGYVPICCPAGQDRDAGKPYITLNGTGPYGPVARTPRARSLPCCLATPAPRYELAPPGHRIGTGPLLQSDIASNTKLVISL